MLALRQRFAVPRHGNVGRDCLARVDELAAYLYAEFGVRHVTVKIYRIGHVSRAAEQSVADNRERSRAAVLAAERDGAERVVRVRVERDGSRAVVVGNGQRFGHKFAVRFVVFRGGRRHGNAVGSEVDGLGQNDELNLKRTAVVALADDCRGFGAAAREVAEVDFVIGAAAERYVAVLNRFHGRFAACEHGGNRGRNAACDVLGQDGKRNRLAAVEQSFAGNRDFLFAERIRFTHSDVVVVRAQRLAEISDEVAYVA